MTVEKAVLNRYLFTQIGLDSGALTTLGVVLHNFGEPGSYLINVWRGDRLEGGVQLNVDPACAAMQVDIDLAAVQRQDKPCCGDSETPLAVNPKGYTVFHVGSGAGGYAVTAGRSNGDRADKGWNSRELQAGDMFAATILRPGTYAVVNQLARTKAKIKVAYPAAARERYKPADPVFVECTKEEFKPGGLEAVASQSVVFRVHTPTRLRIELATPDDGGNAGPPRQRRTWVRPG
jgi:hypothetical protein